MRKMKAIVCETCGVHTMARADKMGKFCSWPCLWASQRIDLTARFLAKVEKTGSCWLWTAALNKDGYGTIRANAKKATAHRVAYELLCGPIPSGLCVLHTCDNRACVNPSHLWIGTNDENMADMVAKGRSRLCGPAAKLARKAGNPQ